MASIQLPGRSPTPYPEVNEVLRELLDRVRHLLDQRFIGLYLFGSLAAGDSQSERSDIDFVVVTRELLPGDVIVGLDSMHKALTSGLSRLAARLEGAYVPLWILRRHDPTHPAVPVLNEGKFYLEVLWSDWIIQRHQLRRHDLRIAGPSLRDLIDEVSGEDLQWAVLDLLEKWWRPMLSEPGRLHDPGYQPYAVLSMCRSLYTLETGEPTSKTRAAQWGLAVLPKEWSSLIGHAVAWRSGDRIESVERTQDFIRYVLERNTNHPAGRRA
jgi:hypothetical protein